MRLMDYQRKGRGRKSRSGGSCERRPDRFWRRPGVLGLCGLALLAGMGGKAAAQEAPLSARSLGMGGTRVGFSSGGDVMQGNPAAMHLVPRFSGDASYARPLSGGPSMMAGSLVDSKLSALAGGFSYIQQFAEGDEPYGGWRLMLSLAYPLSDRLYIGTTAKYLSIDHLVDNGWKPFRGTTGDLGVMMVPIPSLSIGFVARNVWGPDDPQQPRTWEYGASYRFGGFRLAGDWVLDRSVDEDESNAIYRLGAEYLLKGQFPLRAGFIADTRPEQAGKFWTAGLGWMSPAYGMDVGYQQEIGGDQRMLSVSLQMFFR